MMNKYTLNFLFVFLLLTSITYWNYGQSVEFNHLYTVLTPSKLKALTNHPFVRDTLFIYDQRTTKAGDGSSWTGQYLYAKNNYLEFFDTTTFINIIGYSGIAYYLKSYKEMIALHQSLPKMYADSMTLRTKALETQTLNWFYNFGIADTSFLNQANIYSWIMQYHKDYFDYNALPYKNNQYSVTNYVSNYFNAETKRWAQKVVGLQLNLTESEILFYTQYLQKLGFKKLKNANETLKNKEGFSIEMLPKGNKVNVIGKIIIQLDGQYPARKINLDQDFYITINKNKATLILND